MSDFVLVAWEDADPGASAFAAEVGAQLKGQGWRLAWGGRSQAVWLDASRPLSTWRDPDGRWCLLGDLFGAAPQTASRATPQQTVEALLAQSWGRYVAVFFDAEGALEAVFRDPSSTLDVVIWRGEGVAIVASDLAPGLLESLPELTVDWEKTGAAMIDPLRLAGAPAVRGLEGVTPGALRCWQGGRSTERLVWRPAAFARQNLRDAPDLRRELVRRLDQCIEAYCGLGGGVIAELSGGLDSSTVATALVRAPSANVLQWLHYYIPDPAGDERPYARAMAATLGVKLTEALKPPGELDHEAIIDFAFGAKPTWRVIDGAYDRDLAHRIGALGASRVMTGLGGDTVYMQGGDRWLGVEALSDDPSALVRIARRAKRSVWEIARKGVLGRLGLVPSIAPEPPAFASTKARAALAAAPGHAWLEDLDGVSPAKQQQILGLAHTLLIHGRSRRSRAADVVSPLMSQPIVELCLSLSALAQTGGGDDRWMAREAFRDRLAPEVYRRRSKAGYGAYYGRMLGQDLDHLRTLLMEGVLAQAGLLDLVALDEVLSADTLIRSGPYRDIMNLVILEYWAASWRTALSRSGGVAARERLVQPG